MYGWIIAAVLGGGLLLFLTVIIIRAMRFRPAPIAPIEIDTPDLDREKIVADMADMVRCKTVSYRDYTLEDAAEFEKFQALLCQRFPRIHEVSAPIHLGRNGLLYHIPG